MIVRASHRTQWPIPRSPQLKRLPPVLHTTGKQHAVTLSLPVCRVVATVSTGRASRWHRGLAALADWNGRFEGLGSGGFGGSINYTALAGAVARGFATANTDTGHVGGSIGAIGQTLPWVQILSLCGTGATPPSIS